MLISGEAHGSVSISLQYKHRYTLSRKSKATVSLKTGRFDNIDLAVIMSSVCKAVQNCKN